MHRDDEWGDYLEQVDLDEFNQKYPRYNAYEVGQEVKESGNKMDKFDKHVIMNHKDISPVFKKWIGE